MSRDIDTTIDYQHAIGAGTGIVLDPGGAILTNFHVVQGADSVTATVAALLPRRPRRLRPRPRHRGPPVARRRRPARRSARRLITAGRGRPRRRTGERLGIGQSTDARSGPGSWLRPDHQRQGRTDGKLRTGDRGDRVRRAGARRRLGRTSGERRRSSRRHDHRGHAELQDGTGRPGFAIPINDAMGTSARSGRRRRTDSVHIGPPTLIGVGVSAREQQRDLPGVIIHEVLSGGPAQQAGLSDGDVLHQHRRRRVEFGQRADQRARPALPRRRHRPRLDRPGGSAAHRQSHAGVLNSTRTNEPSAAPSLC